MRKKIVWMTVSFLMVLSLIIPSCSPAEKEEEEETVVEEEETVVEEEETVVEEEEEGLVSPEGPQYGGVLRSASNAETIMLGNPHKQPYPSMESACIESLLLLDEQGKPVPWLATDWEWDSDLLGLTFTLREGVMFHDGTKFDADAAKWNLDKCIAARVTELRSVDSVDVIDDNHIRLNLNRTDGLLIHTMTVQRGCMVSPTAYQNAGATDEERDAWGARNPVGTGPFKFVSWVIDVNKVYEKNPDYWQEGKPYLDKIQRLVIVNETTGSAAFEAGELDVITLHSGQLAKRLIDTGNYNVSRGDVTFIGGVMPDSVHEYSPWADIRVRQALGHAIDSQLMVDALGFGQWKVTNQFDTPERWGYNPDVVGYPYDPAKAIQLLEEADYPDGFDTTIYCMQQSQTIAQSIQGFLGKVGITADVQVILPAKRVEMYSKAGWEGLWLWEVTVTPTTLYSMFRNFSADAVATRINSCYVPTELSAIVAEAVVATDFETQQALTWQVQKDMVDKYCVMPYIYAQYDPTILTKKVHNLRLGETRQLTPWITWKEK